MKDYNVTFSAQEFESALEKILSNTAESGLTQENLGQLPACFGFYDMLRRECSSVEESFDFPDYSHPNNYKNAS